MTDLISTILDSLQVDYGKVEVKEVLHPFKFQGGVVQKNILIRLDKGALLAGKDAVPMKEGDFYFVPAGAGFYARFGKGSKYIAASPDSFDSANGLSVHVNTLNSFQDVSGKSNIFSIFLFNTSLHKIIPFFPLLNLNSFLIPGDERLDFFLHQLCMEEEQDKIGKSTLLKNYSSEIVIYLFRFLSTQKQFAANIEKINYLFDHRLVKIIWHVQENLDKDLSNKRLAEVAFLSEDYISQFFKSLTQRNLQDYVEEQRMQKAHDLVMTTSESMKEIAQRVGFKDAAYFSRRFKHKFETKATAMRKADRALQNAESSFETSFAA